MGLTSEELALLQKNTQRGKLLEVLQGTTGVGMPVKIAVVKCNGNAWNFVAFHEGKIAGLRRVDRKNGEVVLSPAEFTATPQNLGIGSALTAEALKRSAALKPRQVLIESFYNDRWKKHLVEKLGGTESEGGGVVWERKSNFGGRTFERHLLRK